MHRALVQKALDVPIPPSVVMAPWIDTDRFRPLGLSRDIDVLYVGTISRRKGYQHLLDRFGPSRLTFAGPNALGEPVQGSYLGPVPYDDLPVLYNRARTFAHLPDWYEPMGRAVVEAGLCGCDVVTNDRVGAMSFERATITDPAIVSSARERFWTDLERAVAEAI
jgi:glycosyltransferase involved in cell wall biosynthesis